MNKEIIKHKLAHTLRRMKTSVKWIIFAILSGVVVGGIGTVFNFCLAAVTQFRADNSWMIWLLPVGGVLIVGTYHLFHDEGDTGTNQVIASIHSGENLPLRMAPSIFFSTLVTHLCGGSAGREGAALQIGGSIGNTLGGWFGFDEKDRHVMTMCGMSAAFSALFGTPMAAAIFAMEVECVGVMYYAALVPCVLSSLVAQGLALHFGATGETFLLSGLPDFTAGSAVLVSVLAILCAFVSILFCVLLHQAGHLYKRFFKNPYVRILAGGCFLTALTLLVGDQRYNGAGMNLIEECMEGNVRPEMFLMKIVFTALTLGAGYKGGEIVPSFCIGGTFGCLFGTLVGFSPALCTGVGMAGVFCGVTNCPISSLLICFELFGYEGMPYFLLTIGFSYLFSGYYGLYSTQKILYSKYKTRYIDKKAE